MGGAWEKREDRENQVGVDAWRWSKFRVEITSVRCDMKLVTCLDVYVSKHLYVQLTYARLPAWNNNCRVREYIEKIVAYKTCRFARKP